MKMKTILNLKLGDYVWAYYNGEIIIKRIYQIVIPTSNSSSLKIIRFADDRVTKSWNVMPQSNQLSEKYKQYRIYIHKFKLYDLVFASSGELLLNYLIKEHKTIKTVFGFPFTELNIPDILRTIKVYIHEKTY